MKLIDFNPIFGTTSPLLFNWEDLGYTQACANPENMNGSSSLGTNAREHVDTGGASSSSVQDGGPGALRESAAEAPPLGRHHHGRIEQNQGEEVEGDLKETAGTSSSEESSADCEIRVLLQANKVQPAMPTSGVPFDLIDNSSDSAYTDLIERLRERQVLDD